MPDLKSPELSDLTTSSNDSFCPVLRSFGIEGTPKLSEATKKEQLSKKCCLKLLEVAFNLPDSSDSTLQVYPATLDGGC